MVKGASEGTFQGSAGKLMLRRITTTQVWFDADY